MQANSFEMAELITHFPGQELPVSEVGERLRQMWDSDGEDSPSHFRASQMNIVLHFGFQVKPAEAVEAFQFPIAFIAALPRAYYSAFNWPEQAGRFIKAKLFNNTTLGRRSVKCVAVKH